MTLRSLILEALASPNAACRNWTTAELSQATGERFGAVERELERMAASGEVVAVDDGWELVPVAKPKQGSLFNGQA